MTDAKSFNCPNCGSPLMPNGNVKGIKCPYCDSFVIVPEELRGAPTGKIFSDERDPFGSGHLHWLIQNGADAIAKVDSVKDKGETVVIYWSGTKAAGGKFTNHAEVDKQSTPILRRGDTLMIKYNPDDKDEIDFAFQINGRFYWDTTLWDLWGLD